MSALVHPLPILAIAVLAANDHLFKAWWPGLVTGKLSDVAGLAFFPLLLAAAIDVGTARRSSNRVLVACAMATGVVFALVNTWGPADAAYRFALGVLQWPARGELVAIAHVSDAGDLIALPALALAFVPGFTRPTSPVAVVNLPDRTTSPGRSPWRGECAAARQGARAR